MVSSLHHSRCTTAAAAVLALVLALASVNGALAATAGKALNKNIQNYEAVNIDASHVLRQSRYSRSLFRHSTPFSFELAAYEKKFTFDLQPNDDLFTSDLQIAMFDGSERTEIFLNDRTYYKGSVNGDPTSRCHMRVSDDGSVHGNFEHDGEKYQIDPVAYHDIDAEEKDSFNHVVYSLKDHVNADIDIPSHCGSKAMTPEEVDESGYVGESRSRRAAFDATRTICDVAFIADSLFYTNVGNGDISRTIDLMTARFDAVQAVYQTDNTIADSGTGVQIGIRIGYFEIQSNAGSDPYNPRNFNGDGEAFLRFVSTDPNAAQSGVKFEDYCVTHLLTYQDFNDGLLGLAWVGSTSSGTPGGICQRSAVLSGDTLTANTGFSTQINYNRDVPTLTAYLVMAHEMGHNFGSTHDSNSNSNDGEYLMYPVSVSGSDANNFKFSPRSLGLIGDVISSKGGCFIASSEPSCGNGVQEGVEACDCGTSEALCANIDSCCTASMCTLAGSSACSPRHSQDGACCNEDCTLKAASTPCRAENECQQAVVCTAGGECPDATAKDDYLACTSTSSLVCKSGLCDTSVCDAWGLTEDTSTIGSCLVYCDMGGTPTTTDMLGMPTNAPTNSSGMAIDLSSPLSRAPGESCRFSATEAGQCNDALECVQANTNIFDRISNFLNSIDLNAIKDWFLRTDHFIPNYGWCAIGLALLIALISLCCCCSNKMDRSKGIV